jgi:hypothetical protein
MLSSFLPRELLVYLHETDVSEFFENRNRRFGRRGFLLCVLFFPSQYEFLSPGWMHANNEENNGKQDKPELSHIYEHTLQNREKEQVDHFNKRVEEKEEQTRQKFMFIPFHRKIYGKESNNKLNNSIQDHARSQECRDHCKIHLSRTMRAVVYLKVCYNFHIYNYTSISAFLRYKGFTSG